MPDAGRLKGPARALRRSMTDAERVLWARLRNRQIAGAKFRRQVPIGPYVVDFACLEARLIVEVDGGQHAERAAADGERSRILAGHGYAVLRFWNNEVLPTPDGVLAAITAALHERRPAPHPDPLPEGEGEEGNDGAPRVA